MGELARDVRFAFRQIAERKLFSAVVIALVALGIGANAILFSFVDGLHNSTALTLAGGCCVG